MDASLRLQPIRGATFLLNLSLVIPPESAVLEADVHHRGRAVRDQSRRQEHPAGKAVQRISVFCRRFASI